MAKLKITQVRSKNGSTKRQIANLTSLGLRKMHQTVEVEKTPVTDPETCSEVRIQEPYKG